MKTDELVIVLDFGSQYSQLIARRVRECGVHTELWPYDTPVKELKAARPKALILSGGPASVFEAEAPRCDPGVFELDVPVLGICYGLQLIGDFFGADVNLARNREYGDAELTVESREDLFSGFDGSFHVWMSHGDQLETLPGDFENIGHTDNSPHAAIRHKNLPLFGLQFHPEVVHTAHGKEILENFVRRVAGCKEKWTPAAFVESAIAEIKRTVKDGRVLCGVSGGVDSAVLYALLRRAIGQRSVPVLIDTGLLREGEVDGIRKVFSEHFGIALRVENCSSDFVNALNGVSDPEEKRTTIGRVFISCFERIARDIGEMKFLAQGTLYPDVIESLPHRGPSATIKSHHNVGGLPDRMDFALVEPLRELFKDEVRRVGAELGLPRALLSRHPFPGPGLAVRILGVVTAKKLETLRRADSIFVEELRAAGWYDRVWQALTVLLPFRSVGVMGDQRTYECVVALRAVTSEDGMTADWARLPGDLLGRVATRIINEVVGVNRVVYDVSSKPPATIEWE